MTTISVIVPIFNTEKYLSRCISSILNQTIKDIEILCVNDCSTDNSLKILQEFSKLMGSYKGLLVQQVQP